MKTSIKLNWLEITNFKGIVSFKTTFNNETNVYGRNEAGKTSLSDAWHWLLTGKDSLDREKFNIKNTVDTRLNVADHEVKAGITVNGNEMKLCRVLKENWVKPQGQMEKILKGNVQEFFINDVPFNATQFQAEINKFLQDDILKMITNPFYFNRLKWQDQRAVLNQMGGMITDDEIFEKITKADNKGQIDNLTKIINSGKSLDQYKKQVAAEKKLLKDKASVMPTRIDEATRSLPEATDYSTIEVNIAEKQNAIADIDILINDETAAFNKKNLANIEVGKQINALKIQVINAENAIRNTALQSQNEHKLKAQGVDNNIQSVAANITSKKALIASKQLRITTVKAEKAALLEKHALEASKVLVYDEHEFSCPTCLRALEPTGIEAKKASMADNFANEKNRTLASINEKGKSMVAEIKEAEIFVNTLATQVEALEIELATLQLSKQEIDQVKSEEVNTEKVIADNIEIKGFKAQISDLEITIADVAPADIESHKTNKAKLTSEITELQSQLAGKAQRTRLLKRIEELKAEEAEMNQKIADYEGIEFTIAEFDRTKVKETESRVNRLFKNVRFKMFEYTLDGNPVDICTATFKGSTSSGYVPYADLNTAGKVQAGLEIIDALSQYYGVEAPVFIDCRESVTDIPEMHCQVVNLIVSAKDKTLRVA